MGRYSKSVLVAGALGIVGIIYFIRITAGTGPLENARAETLLSTALRIEPNRVEAIAPDGEPAMTLPKSLRNVHAIDCPEVASRTGTLPGRYGAGTRTYGSAAFECLFLGESPSGIPLYFSAYVYRTADPSASGNNDGHVTMMQKAGDTRVLMRRLGREARSHTKQEQAALWAELAAEDIYVPADTSQKSPLQEAMEQHKRRLQSR